MNFAKFFIDRPIFAIVISLVIMLVGGISYLRLPVSQYPDVAPPTIVVTTVYPGATPKTIAETVATPLEQEINGVEDLLYMQSQSTVDGTMQLTLTFKPGTDIDRAQVLVQNRVSVAEPRLPPEVRQIGVQTKKASPDLLMVVHMISPDGSRDQLYISNYVYLQLRDVLARLDGVGDINVFGGRQYSMRIWLDFERISSLGLTAGEVLAALREQNIQVAAGSIGQEPMESPVAFQVPVSSQGRLREPSEFESIVVKSSPDGRLVRLTDVARVEIGAQDYTVNSYLNGKNAVAMVVFQRPGSNAVETAATIEKTMDRLAESFPSGLAHAIVYNPTKFVEESIDEVMRTLIEAVLLVALTVFIFLQNWRATIIPVVAIPISLIGTFAIMQALGFSLNNLSLFGLVLAIGIVVDDAIVVVESVERLIADGLSPKDATRRAMNEVSSALIATSAVLIAVFVPTAFIPGLSGQFYRQFALTISASTAISTLVSLTLSPALSAMLLRPHAERKGFFAFLGKIAFGWFFWLFNKFFDVSSRIYSKVVARTLRLSFLALLLYAGLVWLTGWSFQKVPSGFIPAQDQGYLIIAVQLPNGASLARTDAVVKKASEIALGVDGIRNTVAFVGFSGATRVNSANAAAIFTALTPARDRAKKGRTAEVVLNDLRQKLSVIEEGFVFVLSPPPVPGIGTGGGFKMQIQDRAGLGYDALQAAAQDVANEARTVQGLVQVFSTFNASTPQFYADIDRTKARMLNVPVANIFEALQVYLGSIYVNDFNYLGRVFRVTAQAESKFRDEKEDILRLRTRNASGNVVSLGSVVSIEDRLAPDRVVRHNLYPAADINGETLAGFSTNQALDVMEEIAAKKLPRGMSYEWTDLAFQARSAGNTALFIFPLCVLLAFLTLAAQYESWLLPLAVILIVPLCLLFGLGGIWIRDYDNNVLVQVGFVVLIGLACKNSILIVEFAKSQEDAGMSPFDAAVESCRLRLRPILMTALAFILGVIPLVIATGAGSEMRRALGTTVFAGMIGVTFLGLLLTPVFYYVLRRLTLWIRPAAKKDS